MPYCWKCGESLMFPTGCPACGATADARRPLPPDASDEARAMRAIYDRYGCQRVLTQPAILYNALGDFLGEDGRKLRNQVRTAISAGLGQLYLTQLTAPAPGFHARAAQLLQDEGLAAETAQQLLSLFDDMTGLPAEAVPAPQPEAPQAKSTPTPVPESKLTCWKCGQSLPDATSPCPVCGATDANRRPLLPDASKEAKAMRAIYDYYGCRKVLTQPAVLYNALGDLLGEDGRTLYNHVRTAMNAGLGQLYLSQLAAPSSNFPARATELLTSEGLSTEDAQHLLSLFNDMTGLPTKETPTPQPKKSAAPLIALVVMLAVVIIVLTIMFFGRDISTPASTAEPTATVVVTAEPTDVPTDVPTEMPIEASTPDTSHWGELREDRTIGSVFGSKYKRAAIHSITFQDTTAYKPADAWDVSAAKDGTVWAWVTSTDTTDSEGTSLYDLIIAGEGGVRLPKNSHSLFSNYRNVVSIDFGGCVDTSNVINMYSMFDGCQVLTSLDLSSFNTSGVTDMYGMFNKCQSLTTLDLSSFDTSSVTDMGYMFNECRALTTLDLSSFDTANVTSMEHMFNECRALTTLDLSSFNTANVTSMGHMFNECQSLTTLDLSSFDTIGVTDMAYMFYKCQALTTLDLSSFDTESVTNMSYMFSWCQALTTLNLSSFSTASVTNMGYMFTWCQSLTTVTTSSSFIILNRTDTVAMFFNCPLNSISDFTFVD